MLTEKRFETGAVSLHYVEGPTSGIPLVLLHGATSRWQVFLPSLPFLAFRYHIYAVDLRGHGLSGRTPGAYRCIDYTEDIVHFLQERVKQPAILLGHSLGACMAAQAAADAPHLAHALILEEPTPALVSATWEQERLSAEHLAGQSYGGIILLQLALDTPVLSIHWPYWSRHCLRFSSMRPPLGR